LQTTLSAYGTMNPNKLLSSFAVLWDVDNPASAPETSVALISRPLSAGIGADLLATLQNLKLGGQ
jgi:hypothetical protein